MKKIKVGKEVFEVKENISLANQLMLADICVEQFSVKDYDIKKLPLIKGLYNLFVLALQTDLYIEGLENIDGDIHFKGGTEEIEKFIENGLFSALLPAVSNYNEVWEIIYESIKICNIANGLNEGANTMLKSIEEMQAFVDKNKEAVDSAIMYSGIQTAEKAGKEAVVKVTTKQKNKTE